MLQRFLPDVLSVGEFSLVFFSGTYSHAAVKHTGRHDFRVHREFGGTWSSTNPASHFVDTAYLALKTLGWQDLTYCRVDGITAMGEFHVTEVEVIEPFLFFFDRYPLHKRFAEACSSRLAGVH